ncbi:MAG: hypothetical protein BWZ01_03096 [Deltaproteobacteria bacterium ADurb.BinA179]|nr:MAG: hypothetical protein BWZ01_03096 [Deltaproteobacteria bacterium ADurb.BinA179]
MRDHVAGRLPQPRACRHRRRVPLQRAHIRGAEFRGYEEAEPHRCAQRQQDVHLAPGGSHRGLSEQNHDLEESQGSQRGDQGDPQGHSCRREYPVQDRQDHRRQPQGRGDRGAIVRGAGLPLRRAHRRPQDQPPGGNLPEYLHDARAHLSPCHYSERPRILARHARSGKLPRGGKLRAGKRRVEGREEHRGLLGCVRKDAHQDRQTRSQGRRYQRRHDVGHRAQGLCPEIPGQIL